MATTVSYKNNTLATVNNQTKTLKTAGKYLEGDITLVDISGGVEAVSIVDTPDAAGGTVRTITALDISDTTAVAGDVASGKYFYTAAGVKTVGTGSGGGGADCPTFTVSIDDDTGDIVSVTCDKTFAQCLAYVDDDDDKTECEAIFDCKYYYDGDVVYESVNGANAPVPASGATSINYYQPDTYDGMIPFLQITYNSSGTITYTMNPIDRRDSTDLSASTLTVTAPAGYYESNATTTLTDANLVAGNIKKDVTIFGTTGTYEGSGGGAASQKQVNFIDYDGTILYSYTAQEANALSALPANPSHSGLTAQGWNWTLAQIKAQLIAMPDAPVWVGQMYITQSGDTEIDLRMPEGRLSPILTICVNGTITVDWGDNTTADTVTGTSLTTQKAVPHTYTAPGDYTIKVHVVSGSFTFYGSTSYFILRKNTTANENRVYANCVQAIRLGSGVTSIGGYAFYYCYSLSSITIPSGVTSIGTSAFQTCTSLSSITIPSDVTSISASAFSGCYSLSSITIPSGVTSIGTGAFSTCPSLVSISIPSGVTSIANQAFYTCSSLASITIPSGVTSIGNSAFSSCYGVAEYHIKPTSVPTGGTTMFNSIASDCVIYVPSAKLNDYKTAENWSTYASYMQGE